MSERKVLNKYFPPDFDPSKIPRKKVSKEEQHKVRLMAPFSMQCATCGDYIYKGKKFNARKERAEGETYLGMQIFRFYIRCPKCAAEITFKTDYQNTDYVAEHGALRNFEPWRDESSALEQIKAEKEAQEENNPMKALENRTIASKREMDILDALDEIRTKNAQLERKSVSSVVASAANQAEMLKRLQDEADEREAKAAFEAFYGSQDDEEIDHKEENDDGVGSSQIHPEEKEVRAELLQEPKQVHSLSSGSHASKGNPNSDKSTLDSVFSAPINNKRKAASSLLGVVVHKKNKAGNDPASQKTPDAASTVTVQLNKPPAAQKQQSAPSALSSLGDYGSDSD